MQWEQARAHWDQVKGRVRQSWGKLTDDELEQTRGRRDRLVGKIRERYGDKKEEIEAKLDELIARI